MAALLANCRAFWKTEPIAHIAQRLTAEWLKKRLLCCAKVTSAGKNYAMVAVLPRAELQVPCETQSLSACVRPISMVSWTSPTAAQPHELGLSWTSGPGSFGLLRILEPNKLGQYYAWNRTYDINTGRWTAPDPVARPFWNLTDYLHGSPIRGNDARGLAKCDMTIYTRSSGDKVGQLPAMWASDCESTDAKAFLKCLKDFKTKTGCNCIKSLLIQGHGASGLGGNESVTKLTEDERREMRMLMCNGAEVEVRKCSSFDNAADMDVVTVLTGGGTKTGVGHGYTGLICPGILADLVAKDLWLTPNDAGVDDQEINLVRVYNKDNKACWDTYQDSIGIFTSKEEDEAAYDAYLKCISKSYAKYIKDRTDYRNLKK